MSMEAEKSCDLPSRNRRLWEASASVPRPKSQRADGIFFCLDLKAWQLGEPRAEEEWCLSSYSQAEFSLALVFCCNQALGELGDGHHVGEDHLLTQSTNFGTPTLTDKPRSSVYPAIRASCGPVKLTRKINHCNCIWWITLQ